MPVMESSSGRWCLQAINDTFLLREALEGGLWTPGDGASAVKVIDSLGSVSLGVLVSGRG